MKDSASFIPCHLSMAIFWKPVQSSVSGFSLRNNHQNSIRWQGRDHDDSRVKNRPFFDNFLDSAHDYMVLYKFIFTFDCVGGPKAL
jgi:hypothetical protein